MSSLDKLRAVELDLLSAFINVCERKNLTYYAMFGTLLGAVRNGGFLTWDDDIDVVMPTGDYNRLCAHKEWFDDACFGGKYFLQMPMDEGRPKFAKLRKNGTAAFGEYLTGTLKRGGHLGISIDIIPLDDIYGTELCGTPVLSSRKGEAVFTKDMFFPAKKLTFEGLEINVPGKYRKVLNLSYPDGWAWPIGADIVSPHYWFYDTERDYTYYVKLYTGMLNDIAGKDVYLFGAADSLRIWLERYGDRANVVCTFDNDGAKWGTETLGVEVRNPAELPGLIKKDVNTNSRVIIVSLWHQEIGRQLESIGVNEYYVFLDFLF